MQPTKFAVLGRASQKTMSRIGREILRGTKTDMAESGTFERGRGRDLLSLLVRANTAKDVPENQRLSENEVLARMSLLGWESTSIKNSQLLRGANVPGCRTRDVRLLLFLPSLILT
jgi:hypothetical protein